jgi:putative ABC transport system substrate-binding protein
VPNISTIGFLENPGNPIDELMTTAVQEAAAGIGLRIQTLKAATIREIDTAFESLVLARTGALLISNDNFLNIQNKQIIALAKRHAVPVMYGSPEFVVAGGLVSYGASMTDMYRQLGLYAGRILQGANPADLPVMQSTKLELVINLRTAKSLGLNIPDKLLALADEVIE